MPVPSDWIEPDWPAPHRVKALVTTRNGGVSQGPYASLNLGIRVGDDAHAVSENRARVRALLPSEPKWLRQVHGLDVVQADRVTVEATADAAFTRQAGVVCAVQSADCLPVLLCDREGASVAIAHAGWRGLSAGVLENAVAALDRAPEELIAWLGPAIGPGKFEVGLDVFEAYTVADPAAILAFEPLREGKWLADLYALARRRLSRAGVTAVFGGGLCTVSDPVRFFSHRRDRVTGRQGAFIWIAA
ncbi:MAG TPA: peptidoglycan editing factor PgeF [Burkholderiales bacterium]|nr:peptidoglycan editing factor PgeF [Burkholderiales bacterium]